MGDMRGSFQIESGVVVVVRRYLPFFRLRFWWRRVAAIGQSDLQAWIVEGIIPRRARSRLGRNLASRKSNSIFPDGGRIWERSQEIGIRRFASDFGREDAPLDEQNSKKEHGRERCADCP